jgi:ribose transport system substrate-binding protein
LFQTARPFCKKQLVVLKGKQAATRRSKMERISQFPWGILGKRRMGGKWVLGILSPSVPKSSFYAQSSRAKYPRVAMKHCRDFGAGLRKESRRIPMLLKQKSHWASPYWMAGLAAVMLTLAGCSRSEGTSQAEKSAQRSATSNAMPQMAIGVSLWTTEDPWHMQMKRDLEETAAKHPELKLVFMDAKNDAAKQQDDVQQLVAGDIRLLIVCPKDAQALTEPIAARYEAGLPIIVLDRPLIGDKYTCYIELNNKQIGLAVAKWLADKLHGKGKIVLIKGPVDSIPCEERQAAFRSLFRDPGYRFVYESHVDPPHVTAAQVMQEALAHVDQINAVFAYTDEAAEAAHEVAKAAGRDHGILYLGVGGLPEGGKTLVAQGVLDASVLRPTGGVEAIETAVKVLGRQRVPKTITLNGELFTKTETETEATNAAPPQTESKPEAANVEPIQAESKSEASKPESAKSEAAKVESNLEPSDSKKSDAAK